MKLRDSIFRPWRFAPFALPEFLRRIINAGTGAYSRTDRRFLAVANVTGYLGMLSSLSFAMTFAMVDASALRVAIVGNLISAFATALTPLTHRFGRSAAAVYLGIVYYSTLFFFVSELGRDSGIQLNFIAAGAIVITILGAKRVRLSSLLIFIGLVLHLVTWFAFPVGKAAAALTPEVISQIYIQSAATIMVVLAVVVYYILRLSEAAQQRSDALLANTLPEHVAERLMANPEGVIADRHEDATVMFADLRDFTPLSTQLGPETTVGLLDEMFSAFDDLADKYGVEKIKTIGDAYMAVAGAPLAHESHADAILCLALDMCAAVDRLSKATGLPLKLRIGIETGPVVAGVIGRSKFAYDVWGKTVNIAARLQPLSDPGDILVGDGSKRALGAKYVFRSFGTPVLQGVGAHPAWLLTVEAGTEFKNSA